MSYRSNDYSSTSTVEMPDLDADANGGEEGGVLSSLYNAFSGPPGEEHTSTIQMNREMRASRKMADDFPRWLVTILQIGFANLLSAIVLIFSATFAVTSPDPLINALYRGLVAFGGILMVCLNTAQFDINMGGLFLAIPISLIFSPSGKRTWNTLGAINFFFWAGSLVYAAWIGGAYLVDLVNQSNLADVGYPIPVNSYGDNGYGFYPLWGVIVTGTAIVRCYRLSRKYKVPDIDKDGHVVGSRLLPWYDLTTPRTHMDALAHAVEWGIVIVVFYALVNSPLNFELLIADSTISSLNRTDLTFYVTGVVAGEGVGLAITIIQACLLDKWSIYVSQWHLEKAAAPVPA
jgi:hypothetical protein